MKLRQRLTNEMKEGMRSRDTLRVSVLRLLLASIKNKEIEKGKGAELSEEELLRVISAAAKQRRDSIEQFSKAGREDLAEKEGQELKVLLNFLPEALSSESLREKVEEAIATTGATGIKEMGRVMKVLIPQLVGRAEGGAIRQMVQRCLKEEG